MGQSVSRPCPCCEGRGCEECDGTGQRVTTYIEKDGVTARVTGSQVPSDESREAMAAVMKAAYDQLTSRGQSGLPLSRDSESGK